MFAVITDSLQLPVRDQLLDLGTALIPFHDDSSSFTKGRYRTCRINESAGESVRVALEALVGSLETLAAYVKALGGRLKIVADFGDESYVLG